MNMLGYLITSAPSRTVQPPQSILPYFVLASTSPNFFPSCIPFTNRICSASSSLANAFVTDPPIPSTWSSASGSSVQSPTTTILTALDGVLDSCMQAEVFARTEGSGRELYTKARKLLSFSHARELRRRIR